MRVMSERERERRWWGSVAAHGSTMQADEEWKDLPPLPPSPTLSALTSVSRGVWPVHRSMSVCSACTNSFYNSTDRQDQSAIPQTHLQDRMQAERMGGFRGVVWDTERQRRGLDEGARVSIRRSTTTVDPTDASTHVKDWAVGKV